MRRLSPGLSFNTRGFWLYIPLFLGLDRFALFDGWVVG
jgi:hypothetical protein